MTKTEIKTLLTSILGGISMDDDVFNTFLQMAKNRRESSRDWMKLRVVDTSITFTTSDTYTTGKTLPARFLKLYKDPFIVDANGGRLDLQPIQLEDAYAYKDSEGFYYIDHANSTISRTGTTAGTLYLPYLRGTADISDSLEWIFPTFAHPLLAFDIAIIQKGGIDWDTVSANQVAYNKETIEMLSNELDMWDADLQVSAIGV